MTEWIVKYYGSGKWLRTCLRKDDYQKELEQFYFDKLTTLSLQTVLLSLYSHHFREISSPTHIAHLSKILSYKCLKLVLGLQVLKQVRFDEGRDARYDISFVTIQNKLSVSKQWALPKLFWKFSSHLLTLQLEVGKKFHIGLLVLLISVINEIWIFIQYSHSLPSTP